METLSHKRKKKMSAFLINSWDTENRAEFVPSPMLAEMGWQTIKGKSSNVTKKQSVLYAQ